ncbi:hypothetical protein JCM10908_006315 [Rhodotorula pacifica]|uniref:F-box protein n=1 Tax=Rhodotorula pacifica TaxID=1495444 RepID=UPI00317F909A
MSTTPGSDAPVESEDIVGAENERQQQSGSAQLPRVTLLDLPDELLSRIFSKLELDYRYAPYYGPFPMSFLTLCKRLRPLVDDICYRTVKLPGEEERRESYLGELLLSPARRLSAVRHCTVTVSSDTSVLILSSLARLHRLETLIIYIERGPLHTEQAPPGLSRLLAGLTCLRTLSLLDKCTGFVPLPAYPIVTSVPPNLERLIISANYSHATSLDTIAGAAPGGLDLRVKVRPGDHIGVLPWGDIRQLTFELTGNDSEMLGHLGRLRTMTAQGSLTSRLTKLSILYRETFHHFEDLIDMLAGMPRLHFLRIDKLKVHTCDKHDHSIFGAAYYDRAEHDYLVKVPLLFALLKAIQTRTSVREIRVQDGQDFKEVRWSRWTVKEEFVRENWRLD